MNECGWAPIKLYLQKQTSGQIWPPGRGVPAPGLERQTSKSASSLLDPGVGTAPGPQHVPNKCRLNE